MDWYSIQHIEVLRQSEDILNGTINWEEPRPTSYDIYDTYIGSLTAANLQLTLSKNEAILSRLDDGEELVRGDIRIPKDPFSIDLQRFPKEITNILEKLVAERVLIRIGSIEHQRIDGIYINREGNPTCKLSLYDAGQAAMIGLEPIPGSEHSAREIIDSIPAADRSPIASEAAWRVQAMERCIDCQPVPSFSLDEDMRIAEAFSHISMTLFSFIEGNEFGVIGEYDLEFLHDYRVSIRKTRVALNQFASVLKSKKLMRYSSFFKLLGTYTTPVRDLDVFLRNLRSHEIFSNFPEEIRGPFITYLTGLRRTHQEHLVSYLESSEYQRLCRKWERLLTEKQDKLFKKKADRNLLPYMQKRLGKLYEQITKDGNAISPKTETEKIHRLRKDCKKLRYMLMFCSSLFDGEALSQLLVTLKSLQDILGHFNDINVHIAYMEQFAAYLRGQEAEEVSINHIVTAIDSLQQEKGSFYSGFESVFTEFTAKGQAESFFRMIHPGEEPMQDSSIHHQKGEIIT